MASSIPTKQKALVIPEAQGQFVVQEVDVLKPGPGEVLVYAEAVGLNPVDWHIQKRNLFTPEYPFISGWEAAGTVVQLGEGVTSLAIGDKVFHAGVSWEHNTTFKQYNVTTADLCGKVPPNMTMDEAASVPLALNTAALGLYCGPSGERGGGAGLTPPWEEGGRGKYAGQPCLVFGGATSIGQFVIQLAKLSGYSPIITTASVKNAEYLKSLGATHLLDRNLPASSLPAAIKEITSDPFLLVYDAVSVEQTQRIGYDILASGGTLVTVLPSNAPPEDKCTPDKRISSIDGTPFAPDRRPLAVKMYRHLPALFARGDLKPNRIEVLPNGLAGIPEGLERLYRNEVSAKKLVARPQETP